MKWFNTVTRALGAMLVIGGALFLMGTNYPDSGGVTGLTALNNATVSELVTVGATVTELDAESTLTYDGDELLLTGHMHIIHTADANDDHGLEMDIDAAGFGDVKGIDIVYTTGTIEAGEDEAAILINIDESAATGGSVAAIEVLATSAGSAVTIALEVGATVVPLLQESGTFGDMDEVDNAGDNHLSQFTSTGTDVAFHEANAEVLVIGDAAQFFEIEFILATVATNPGTQPTFRYSTGSGTWQAFSPTDGTNGFRNTGIIAWTASLVSSPAFAVGASGNYLIEITRGAAASITSPIEDIVQITATTEFSWNESGNVNINTLSTAGLLTMTADGLISGTTPQLTIGDAGEEDTVLVFDGAAVDFHMGLDDTTDSLVIGLDQTPGTNPAITIIGDGTENVTFAGNITTSGTTTATGNLTAIADAIIDDQLAVGGAVVTGAKMSIEFADVQRNVVTAVGHTLHVPADSMVINDGGSDDATIALGAGISLGIPTYTATAGTTTTITDSANLYIVGAPIGGSEVTLTNAYALWVNAGDVLFDAGQLRIGSSATTDRGIIDVSPDAHTAIASTDFSLLRLAADNAITIPGGTTTVFASLYIVAPNITATGTLTNSAAIYITGAATEATNDYAIFVDGGSVRFDGSLWVESSPTEGAAGEQLTSGGAGTVMTWATAGSLREYKQDIIPINSTRDSLDLMLDTQIYSFKYLTPEMVETGELDKDGMPIMKRINRKPSTGDFDTTYVGLMGDEATWAMHWGGKIFNPISFAGHTVLAFQALEKRISELEASW